MKKILTIIVSLLILVSGMHLSVATHFCGGEIAAVKWSFTGHKADCGMEKKTATCPSHHTVASDCCQNRINFFTVDNNYQPASFQLSDIAKTVLQVYFVLPVSAYTQSLSFSIAHHANVNPPDLAIANGVTLCDICVFRC